MNAQFQRGMLLQQQGRFDLAEQAFRQALTEEPNCGVIHAFLALALVNQKQYPEAQREAEMAMGLDPDVGFPYYVMGIVMANRNRPKDALVFVEQAISMNPEDVAFRELSARLHLAERRWQQALDAAEAGLALDPEDVDCANVRSQALTMLGRRHEADRDVADNLRRAPESSESHATLGWSLLHQGRPREACDSFREALRLDPNCGWARQGILEAMKARNPIYALMMRYFLWMGRLDSSTQWGIVIGLYLVSRVISGVADGNPEIAPFLRPLTWLYLIFVFMSWLSSPLFNVVLFFDRFGRCVLNKGEKLESACIVLSLTLAAAALGLGLSAAPVAGAFFWPLLAAVFPLAGAFAVPKGWPTILMIVVYAATLAVGVATAFVGSLTMLWLLLVIGSQFLTNGLMQVRVKR